MNSKRGSRTSVTCVAVIITFLLAACSSQGPEIAALTAPPTVSTEPTAPAYDITRNAPVGYDEWEISGSTDTVPAMHQVADLFGLSGVFIGKGAYGQEPYIGIAPLETHCVVAFVKTYDSIKNDKVGLLVLSRFNPDLSIIESGVSANSMKARIDSYRAMCRSEAPVPAPQQPTSVTTA